MSGSQTSTSSTNQSVMASAALIAVGAVAGAAAYRLLSNKQSNSQSNHRSSNQSSNQASNQSIKQTMNDQIVRSINQSSPVIRNADGSLSLSNPFESIDLSNIEFGSDQCRSLFGINQLISNDQSVIQLNHGSFGSTPLSVIAYHNRMLQHVENNGDQWFRFDSYPANRASIQSINQTNRQSKNLSLNVQDEDCVFVNNATSGVNAIINSFLDVISQSNKQSNNQSNNQLNSFTCATLNLTYGACKYALQSTCQKYGASYLEIPIDLPSTNQSINQTIIQSIDQSKNVKFFLIDCVTSPTALILDWRTIASECRSRGIFCLVDGAHVMSQVGLSLGDSDCDVFVSNLHKWNYAPKGTALLWVNPKCLYREKLHPVIVSWNWRDQSLNQRFWGQGTRDDAAYVAAHAGAKFYQSIGQDRAYDYNTKLADWGVKYLCQQWDVSEYDLVSRDQSCPFMRIVRLPFETPESVKQKGTEAVRKLGDRLLEFCMSKFHLIIACLTFNDQLYCRFSAQIYVNQQDFEKLASMMLLIKRSPELIDEWIQYSMSK